MHKGSGLIIKCNEINKFFIQKKDDTYPIIEYQNCFSFWGGAIKQSESPKTALFREIKEEIIVNNYNLLNQVLFIKKFILKKDDNQFELNFFELNLTEKLFTKISRSKIVEGTGVVCKTNDLLTFSWIWNLDIVAKYYCKHVI